MPLVRGGLSSNGLVSPDNTSTLLKKGEMQGVSRLIIQGDTPTFSNARRAILNGLVSAQSEAAGWNALLASIPDTAVVRTSNTVVTITLPALATYDITALETITATVPLDAVVSGVSAVATPTFTISPVVLSTALPRVLARLQAVKRAAYF